VEKWQVTHFLSNEEQEQWIEDDVNRETAVARKRVEDAETAIKQEHDDMSNADHRGLTSREPEKMFEEMIIAMGDSVIDLASPDGEEDGEDADDEDTELAKLREADEPGWVLGTISSMVPLHTVRYWQ